MGRREGEKEEGGERVWQLTRESGQEDRAFGTGKWSRLKKQSSSRGGKRCGD